MAAFDQAQENEILSVKARQRRDPGQREQKDQHQHGFGGGAEIEACDVVHLIANDVALAQRRDHAERPQIHEGVNQQIQQNALRARRRMPAPDM